MRGRWRGSPKLGFIDASGEPNFHALNPRDWVAICCHLKRKQHQHQSALLSEEHRQVIILRELQGLSYEEIAETVGVPRGTIESRLHRARNELRQMVQEYQN